LSGTNDFPDDFDQYHGRPLIEANLNPVVVIPKPSATLLILASVLGALTFAGICALLFYHPTMAPAPRHPDQSFSFYQVHDPIAGNRNAASV
jgi:hypothetical protein